MKRFVKILSVFSMVLMSALLAAALNGCGHEDAPVCGDGYCDEGETGACSDCDTGPVCGDGHCEAGESAAGCTTDCGSSSSDALLTVENRSSHTVWYLYVSPCSATGWGPDQLGEEILSSGYSVTYSAPPGCYNLKAESSDEGTWTEFGATLSAGQTLTWNLYD